MTPWASGGSAAWGPHKALFSSCLPEVVAGAVVRLAVWLLGMVCPHVVSHSPGSLPMASCSCKEIQGSKCQVFLIPGLGLPRCHFLHILLTKLHQGNRHKLRLSWEGRLVHMGQGRIVGSTLEIPLLGSFSLGLADRCKVLGSWLWLNVEISSVVHK